MAFGIISIRFDGFVMDTDELNAALEPTVLGVARYAVAYDSLFYGGSDLDG